MAGWNDFKTVLILVGSINWEPRTPDESLFGFRLFEFTLVLHASYSDRPGRGERCTRRNVVQRGIPQTCSARKLAQ